MNPAKWENLESRRPQLPRPVPEADSREWQAYLAQMKRWMAEKEMLERESNREALAMVFVRQTPVVTPKADYQFREIGKRRREAA